MGTITSSIGPDGFGYSGVAITPQFVDISPTGPSPTPNAPLLVGVDDGYTRLRSSNLNGFQFKLYNTTYNSIYVSSNGMLTFGSGNPFYLNTDLTSAPPQAAIAPLWSDLVVRGDPNSGVYWQVQGSGSTQRLVVQWNDVIFYNGNPFGLITFEAILNANGTIIFNYKNLNSGDFAAGGASATVGIKDAGTQGSNRLLVSFNSASSPFVGTGTSLEIGVGLATTATDYYAFTLAAGQTTTLAVAGQKSSCRQCVPAECLGNALASGASPGSGSNVSSAINNFVAPSAGTYYAVVTGPSGASYSLVVNRGADFDTEVNGSFATAQNISGTSGVLGDILASPATPTENWYSINLTAGNALLLQTITFGGAGAQFVDNLSPQIQLYTPADVLVASGQGTGNQTLSAVATTTGAYRVRVLANNSTSGEYFLTAIIDATPPTVAITPVSPSPSTTPVSQIQIRFNKPVSGVSLANFSLSDNGGPNLLTASQSLTTSDNMTYTLGNLAPLTNEDGTYTLSLAASPNITDSSGGFLASGASTTFVVNVTELVTTTADSGPGSLRQALLDASGAPGLTHTIQFELPAGSQTISLLSALPALTDPLVAVVDATQNVTVRGPSGSGLDSYNALSKTGDGTLTLTEVHSVSGNLEITGGFLRLSEPSTPTFSSGVTTTVTGTGALELAGSVSVLTSGVNVANNSTAAAGILVSGTNQVIGSISGTGNVVVNAGGGLTANSIVQGSLVIGGTAVNHAVVTIASSDASGSPLTSTSATPNTNASAFHAVLVSSPALSNVGPTGEFRRRRAARKAGRAAQPRLDRQFATNESFNQREPGQTAPSNLVDAAILALFGADLGPVQMSSGGRPELPDLSDVTSLAPFGSRLARPWIRLLEASFPLPAASAPRRKRLIPKSQSTKFSWKTPIPSDWTTVS